MPLAKEALCTQQDTLYRIQRVSGETILVAIAGGKPKLGMASFYCLWALGECLSKKRITTCFIHVGDGRHRVPLREGADWF